MKDVHVTVIDHSTAPPPGQARVYAEQGKLLIGRGVWCDLVLPQGTVTEEHARIEARDGGWVLVDQSLNGTFVNGAAERVMPERDVELKDKDRLRIGGYLIEVSLDAVTAGEGHDGGEGEPGWGRGEERPKQTPAGPDLDEECDGGIASLLEDLFPSLGDDMPVAEARSDDRGREEQIPMPGYASRQSDQVPPPRPEDEPFEEDGFDIRSDGTARRKPRTAPESKVHRPTDRSDEENTRANHFVEAFCRGLGIEPAHIPDEQREAVMIEAGRLLRTMSSELLSLMRARSKAKLAMHAASTQYGFQENNPFKFSADTDELLQKLFIVRAKSDKQAEAAVEEAFRDVRAHLIAVHEALRPALRALLEPFVPTELEHRFERGSWLDGVLPQYRKAKSWDLFVERHGEIAQDAKRGFRRWLRTAFLDAYEEATRRLASAARPEGDGNAKPTELDQ